MRISFLFLIASVLTQLLHAQLAIIDDAGGFIHVREGIDAKSKVVDRIRDFEVFWIIADADSQSNWKDVAFYRTESQLPEDQLEAFRGKLFRNRLWMYGFVQSGKVRMLETLPAVPMVEKSDSVAIFKNDSINISIHISSFDSSQHEVVFKRLPYELKIDGIVPFGVMGEIPTAKFSAISYSHDSIRLEFPGEELQDLYLPGKKFWEPAVYCGPRGEFYITSFNSDGAGAYDLVWVIKDGKILHRYVGTPY